ncbi:MAG: 4Fe-4S dicluster domain-containing protein [Deltaproteobacteria bacterium]|nr:4Fe-4S dicluster domain-containing protein [Deltaproteobacteria bacterium]
MATNESSRRYWLWLRRAVQIILFLLFVVLFLKAEYAGQEILAWPVDLFFRFDPLLLTAHLLTLSPLVAGLFWSLVFVVLTLILGRFFCGWVCPLGATLDACRRLLFSPRPDRGVADRWRRAKYYLLIALLASAPFTVNLVGLFDPLSLLYRTLAIVLYPAFGYAVERAGTVLYHLGPPVSAFSEPVYQFFKATVLPFKPLVYLLPFLTLFLFALVVAAERWDRRFWCRALCPLGALYGLVARFSLLRRRPAALCPDCSDCAVLCKMGALSGGRVQEPPTLAPSTTAPPPTPEGEPGRDVRSPGQPLKAPHSSAECQLCLRCLSECEKGRVSFAFGVKAPRAPLDLGRRQVVTSLAAGVALVPLVRLGSLARPPDEYLIRPPGAQNEAEFLSRCIRCGQCMKVCLTNGLQPVLWEAGLEGLYTPRLVPRMGYCAHTCTLCGQVCPTGAIPQLTLPVKQAMVLGVAAFDRNRCIPYTEGADCLVCEEHCPVSPKAITFTLQEVVNLKGRKVQVKLPVVQPDRCIGCGHCEKVCPVGGAAGIRVRRSLRMEL